jgi:tetratricopeptide (TPR) repeat protein
MKIITFLFFLLTGVSLAYGIGEIRVSDDITRFSSGVDSLLGKDHPDSAGLDLLLKKMQRLNWNEYYEEFEDQGPILKLLDYCRKSQLTSGEIVCINGFGVMYRQIGKPGNASRQHLAALLLSETSHDTMNQMISLNNLGVNSRRVDDLKRATDYHMKVLNLASHFSNQSGTVQKSKCIALNSLGNINISLKQYDKAIKIFKQSNIIERTMNSLVGQAVNLANIGEAFELSGQLDSARIYYQQSLVFNEKAGSVLGIALCNNNLGKIHLKNKQYDQALSYFVNAIQLIRSTGDKYHLVMSLESAASVWIEKKQFQRACKFLDEAIELSKNIDAKIFLKEGYQMLSQISQETGNFHESLDLLTLSHQYSDSIFTEQNQRHLNEIQTKYETEQKEQQIIILNKGHELNLQHMRIQRILLWGLAILSLLVFVVILLLYLHQKTKSRTREIELSQKLLRSQMNPHFIFNSLGAIQHFMLKNDGRKAAFYLSSFSSLMRSILKNSREELITLREEKQTLENYLLLHQLRLGNRLSFEVNIADELDVEETILPPMLIQPFVENAIIHGIEKMEDNGAIVVVFSKESNLLKIIVKDNGKGIDQNPAGTKENHVSYALQIFKERIANLKKSSGINISYKIGNIVVAEDQNQGTVVTVLLPLKLR